MKRIVDGPRSALLLPSRRNFSSQYLETPEGAGYVSTFAYFVMGGKLLMHICTSKDEEEMKNTYDRLNKHALYTRLGKTLFATFQRPNFRGKTQISIEGYETGARFRTAGGRPEMSEE